MMTKKDSWHEKSCLASITSSGIFTEEIADEIINKFGFNVNEDTLQTSLNDLALVNLIIGEEFRKVLPSNKDRNDLIDTFRQQISDIKTTIEIYKGYGPEMTKLGFDGPIEQIHDEQSKLYKNIENLTEILNNLNSHLFISKIKLNSETSSEKKYTKRSAVLIKSFILELANIYEKYHPDKKASITTSLIDNSFSGNFFAFVLYCRAVLKAAGYQKNLDFFPDSEPHGERRPKEL